MKIEDLLGIDILSGRRSNIANRGVIKEPPKSTVLIVSDPDELDSEYADIESEDENTPVKDVVNPGVEYSTNGQAKWSPPLQQQITIMKDTTGTTTDDPTIEPSPDEKDAIVAARTKSGVNSNSEVDELQRLIKLANVDSNKEIAHQQAQVHSINPVFIKNLPI